MLLVFSTVGLQVAFTNIWVKRSLADYRERKVGGCREDYLVQCNRNERRGLAWFQVGIWKLRVLRGGVEGEPVVLLDCQEAQRWREELLGKKWLQMIELVARKKLGRCLRTTNLRQLGTFLYKVRSKWEYHTEQSEGEEEFCNY
jgi:hypothetical protein